MTNFSEKFKLNEDGTFGNINTASTTERFLTTTANQAAGGFADELLDLIGAEDTANRVRSNQRALEQENPGLNFAAGALGFLVPGAALAKGAKVGNLALSKTNRFARAAGVGATEGAVISAGNADGQDILDRGDEALTGALIGAPLGGILGSRILTKQITSGDKQVSDIANILGSDEATVLAQLRNEESLEKIALDAAGGNAVLAERRIQDLADTDPELKRVIGRRAEDALEPRALNIADDANRLNDTLSLNTRGVLDDVDTSVRANSLERQRSNIGEEIGSNREAIDINTGPIVNELINNKESGVRLRSILEKEINNIGELQSSSQIMKNGTKNGEFVVLSDKQAKRAMGKDAVAGVYAKTKKSSGKKEGEKAKFKYEPANLDARVFATVAQRLRQSGNDQLDNSAEDASSTTSVGALLLKASDDINRAVGKTVPELSEQNSKFIRVDAQQRIPNIVNKLLGSGSESTKASLRTRLGRIIEGQNEVFDSSAESITRRNIEPEEIKESIKAAIKEQLDSGKIKNFDEGSTAYKAIKDAYDSAGDPDGFEQLVREIKTKVDIEPIQEAITKALDTSDDNFVSVANSLRSVLTKPSVKQAIDSLGDEKAKGYRRVLNESLKELELIGKTAKGKNAKLTEPPGIMGAVGAQFAFAATVFNSLGKAISISLLRGARDAGVLKNLSKNNKQRSQLIEFLQKNPDTLAIELTRRLQNSTPEDLSEGWLARNIRNIVRQQTIVSSVDTSATEKAIQEETGDVGREFKLENIDDVNDLDNEFVKNKREAIEPDKIISIIEEIGLKKSGTFTLEN